MIGLVGLGIELIILLVLLGIGALFFLISLAVGLVTHPLRTLATILNRIGAFVGGIGLFAGLIVWFLCPHDDKDFNTFFWGSVIACLTGMTVYGLTDWFLDWADRRDLRKAIARQTEMKYRERQRVMRDQDDGPAQLTVEVPEKVARAFMDTREE